MCSLFTLHLVQVLAILVVWWVGALCPLLLDDRCLMGQPRSVGCHHEWSPWKHVAGVVLLLDQLLAFSVLIRIASVMFVQVCREGEGTIHMHLYLDTPTCTLGSYPASFLICSMLSLVSKATLLMLSSLRKGPGQSKPETQT